MSQVQSSNVEGSVSQASTSQRAPGSAAPPPSSLLEEGLVVVLNGFPGTGKLTIMRRAQQLLPDDITCLLDNHLLIDPVVAVMPNRDLNHHELRRAVRRPIFQALSKRAMEGHIIVMTACLAADNDTDASCLEEHIDIVRGTGVPLLWVNAHCDHALVEQRLRSQERITCSKTKLTDIRVLREILGRHRLIVPNRPVSNEPASIRVEAVDVSGSVEESVGCLFKILGIGV